MQAPTFQDHHFNTKGKSSNPYQNDALERILNTIKSPQQQTNKSEHPPPQNPYTRVYGKRWTYDNTNNTLNIINTYGRTHTDSLTYPTTKRKLSSPFPHIYKHKINKITTNIITNMYQVTYSITTTKYKHNYTKHNPYIYTTKPTKTKIDKKKTMHKDPTSKE